MATDFLGSTSRPTFRAGRCGARSSARTKARGTRLPVCAGIWVVGACARAAVANVTEQLANDLRFRLRGVGAAFSGSLRVSVGGDQRVRAVRLPHAEYRRGAERCLRLHDSSRKRLPARLVEGVIVASLDGIFCLRSVLQVESGRTNAGSPLL